MPLRLQERLGCDPKPLDPTRSEDRLTLASYVWADQVARFERLRGALNVAAVRPCPSSGGRPARSWPRARAARGPRDVVWHSVVRQYLTPEERKRLPELLAAAGEGATPSAPAAHLCLEPERVGEQGTAFGVALTTWPGGRTRVLADCEGHGPPVVWR